jgi:DNA-binding beta-propeller fold protein YncE
MGEGFERVSGLGPVREKKFNRSVADFPLYLWEQALDAEYPEGIAASRDGKTVYVANWFSDELWLIATDSRFARGLGARGVS